MDNWSCYIKANLESNLEYCTDIIIRLKWYDNIIHEDIIEDILNRTEENNV